jgi:DNA replication licensing factor MCM2
VTGIYCNNFDSSLNHQHGFPVFATVIEANHVSKKTDTFANFRLTEEDVREILQLSKDPAITERVSLFLCTLLL